MAYQIIKHNNWDVKTELGTFEEHLYIQSPQMLCPYGIEYDPITALIFVRLFFKNNPGNQQFLKKCLTYESNQINNMNKTRLIRYLYRDRDNRDNREPYIKCNISHIAEAYSPNKVLVPISRISRGVSLSCIMDFMQSFVITDDLEICQMMVFPPKLNSSIKNEIVVVYYRPNGPAYREAKESFIGHFPLENVEFLHGKNGHSIQSL